MTKRQLGFFKGKKCDFQHGFNQNWEWGMSVRVQSEQEMFNKKIIKYNGDWTNEVNSKEYKNNNQEQLLHLELKQHPKERSSKILMQIFWRGPSSLDGKAAALVPCLHNLLKTYPPDFSGQGLYISSNYNGRILSLQHFLTFCKDQKETMIDCIPCQTSPINIQILYSVVLGSRLL